MNHQSVDADWMAVLTDVGNGSQLPPPLPSN
jgi:hypothetical protein